MQSDCILPGSAPSQIAASTDQAHQSTFTVDSAVPHIQNSCLSVYQRSVGPPSPQSSSTISLQNCKVFHHSSLLLHSRTCTRLSAETCSRSARSQVIIEASKSLASAGSCKFIRTAGCYALLIQNAMIIQGCFTSVKGAEHACDSARQL